MKKRQRYATERNIICQSCTLLNEKILSAILTSGVWEEKGSNIWGVPINQSTVKVVYQLETVFSTGQICTFHRNVFRFCNITAEITWYLIMNYEVLFEVHFLKAILLAEKVHSSAKILLHT